MSLYVGGAVAARPDDRASCPATAASLSSEENHARTRFGTAPVGKEADPTADPDPPLAHRVPEGGVIHPPVPGKYHASPFRRNRFRCNPFMPATPN
jgi:hypothetical protein